jgi:quinol monooxygenase YgiN
MPIIRINEFEAAPEKAAALHAFLSVVVEVIKEAPGCREVRLLTDHEDSSRLAIVETWDSIGSHQAAAGRIPPEQLAAVRPLLAAPPKGRYYDTAP